MGESASAGRSQDAVNDSACERPSDSYCLSLSVDAEDWHGCELGRALCGPDLREVFDLQGVYGGEVASINTIKKIR